MGKFFFHERHLTNCAEEEEKDERSKEILFFLKNKKKNKMGVNYIMKIL
jgi:hypothetical protein